MKNTTPPWFRKGWRKSKEWTTFRTRVINLASDCECCGRVDYKSHYHVHHVTESYRDYDSYFDVNNVMVLCSRCHAWIHGIPLKVSPSSHSELRQKFPKAYEKWTVLDDDKLKTLFLSGQNIVQLAKYFQRQESAIKARLDKLGLTTK